LIRVADDSIVNGAITVVIDAVTEFLRAGVDLWVVIVTVVVADGYAVFVDVIFTALEHHVIAVVVDAVADLRSGRVDALGIVVAVIAAAGNVEEAVSVFVCFVGLAITVEIDAIAEIFGSGVNDGVCVIAAPSRNGR
jgi:hypothetical protein